MTNIVPNDSKYIPLTQQKYCCVPTCVQMVMYRHGIPLIPAEELGDHLGLIVPEEYSKFFWNIRTGEKPKAGYGTRIGEEEFSLNNAFSKLNIPLKVEFKLINEFSDFSEFEKYLLKVDDERDYMVCFSWGILYDEEYLGGHVCLLDKVLGDSDKIRLVDPEVKSSKWEVVDMKKLFDAMKKHGVENMAGFWELEKTN